jgi:hypothetical protein
MYSITENIYYSQLSSVAILLQPEPNCFTSYSTRKLLCSLSVLSSCGLPLPPTCLVLTSSEAHSYFESITPCYFNFNPCSTIKIEKLIFSGLNENSLCFVEPETSLPCPEEPVTTMYPDPHLHAHNLLPQHPVKCNGLFRAVISIKSKKISEISDLNTRISQ